MAMAGWLQYDALWQYSSKKPNRNDSTPAQWDQILQFILRPSEHLDIEIGTMEWSVHQMQTTKGCICDYDHVSMYPW